MPATAAEVAAATPDPELPMVTIGELGIVRETVEHGDQVTVTITPTYSGCPALTEIRLDVTRRLHAAGYPHVDVRTCLDPPWTTDWITAAGRTKLARAGIAPPAAAPRRASGPVPLTLSRPPARVSCPRCGSDDTVELSRFGATACQAQYRCRDCAEPFSHVKAI